MRNMLTWSLTLSFCEGYLGLVLWWAVPSAREGGWEMTWDGEEVMASQSSGSAWGEKRSRGRSSLSERIDEHHV